MLTFVFRLSVFHSYVSLKHCFVCFFVSSLVMATWGWLVDEREREYVSLVYGLIYSG